MITKINRYEIKEKIGQGAMGIVYKAYDPNIGRTVAVKTLRMDIFSDDEDKQEFILRFKREAQTAGRLSHQNIVTIYDLGKDDEADNLFIVMEYIQGKDLKAILSAKDILDSEKALSILDQIADGIDFAHRNGIIHRDIKPANIIITDENKVKITDFGIAKMSGTNLTQTGKSLGTPSYMSPEQVLGRDVTYKSDLFSFATLAYEILTGEKAFKGNNITSVVYKILNERPLTNESNYLNKNAQLLSAFLKCMDKDPEKRYDTAKDFYKDIVKALDNNEHPDHILAEDDTVGQITGIKNEGSMEPEPEPSIIPEDTVRQSEYKPPSSGSSKAILLIIFILIFFFILLASLTGYFIYTRYEINGVFKDRTEIAKDDTIQIEKEKEAISEREESVSIIEKKDEHQTIISDDIKTDISEDYEKAHSDIQEGPISDRDIPHTETYEVIEDIQEEKSIPIIQQKAEEPVRPSPEERIISSIRERFPLRNRIKKGPHPLSRPRGFNIINDTLFITETFPENNDSIIRLDLLNPSSYSIFNKTSLNSPSDIKFSKRGVLNIFIITDTKNQNIKFLDQHGNLLNYIQSDHQSPFFLFSLPDEQVFYVTDYKTGHIYKYDTRGNLLHITENRLERPMGITIHRDIVYIVDNQSKAIHSYNKSLRPIESFSIPQGASENPIGIGIQEDRIFITDPDKNIILLFDISGDYIGPLELDSLVSPFYIDFHKNSLIVSDNKNGYLNIYGR